MLLYNASGPLDVPLRGVIFLNMQKSNTMYAEEGGGITAGVTMHTMLTHLVQLS